MINVATSSPGFTPLTLVTRWKIFARKISISFSANYWTWRIRPQASSLPATASSQFLHGKGPRITYWLFIGLIQRSKNIPFRAVFKWLSKNQNQSNCSDQSQFLAITCNSPEAREKSRVHGAIGYGFASHWLKKWRESFKPITKRSNRNHVITFDSHLKTTLINVT